ncbi:MAG: hypothetical protein K2N24_08055 [Lachnospiraceae bacterium]|nr:hypothetical protein [Lachnospiraceae bacterium]
MSYQAHNDNSLQFGIDTSRYYNQTIGNDSGQETSSALSLGAVGDILTGTVLQGGDSPIVEMNGTPIQVRSTALQNAKSGEQIYLRITRSSASEITMKLADSSTMSTVSRNGAMQTEIMKNTARFVENWNQAQQDTSSEYAQTQEDVDYIMQGLSEEEKAKLRQMGIEISSSNLTIVKSLLVQMRGQEQDADLQKSINSVRKQIILQNPQDAPEQYQLVIQGNTIDASEITKEANSYLPVTEEQTVYLIQNELSLSIENLYKAQYSAKSMPTGSKLSEADFRQMLPQIERTIQTAGLQPDTSTFHAARFLLEHNLPVNTDSLSVYMAIQDLNTNGFQDSQVAGQLADYTAEAMAADTHAIVPAEEHSEPQNASTVSARTSFTFTVEYYRHVELYFSSAGTTADQIARDLSQITEEGFWSFAETGLPYTLSNLSAFCQNSSEVFSDDNKATASIRYSASYSSSVTALTAHRQLEEIRLKMTWEASYTLASEDIHIRAKELSQVVEALRNQERDYYKQQFQAEGMVPGTDTIKLVQEAVDQTRDLPYLPASALGAALFTGTFSMERLHEKGMQALTEMNTTITYTKVTSYETLMTSPRSDMGDSIQKAFRNVDDLLEEMNLPATEDNQRAVRILGYNQMEITQENLEEIKAADGQVQDLIQNLTPSIVLNLVRDGVNPLQLPIEELNTLIENYINEDEITDEGKYSEFLQKLDKKGAITREERKGYIGIYRLLDKITKSKGKDIGTLVRNGQSITLQNLLTAHRSNRAAGMDTTLDESFGGMEYTSSTDSISQQIAEGFARSGEEAASPSNAAIQYNQHLSEQLLNHITPELIDRMVEDSAKGATLEEFFDTIKEQLTESPEDIPAQEAAGLTPEQETAESQIQAMQLENLDFFDEAAYTFMKGMDIFPSITNMTVAADLLKGRNHTFRHAATLAEASASFGPDDRSAADITKQMEELPEHLNSPEEMEQAYAQLETTVAEAVHAGDETGAITAKDIQALKQVRAGLRIMQKMSRQEQFQIPFSFQGEWNVINLSVIQNTETKGLLQADIPTKAYGTISASLSWKQTHWEGTISADQPEGTALLERNSGIISDAMDQITSISADTAPDQAPATSEMYRMAKQLVMLFRHIEG